MQVAERCRLEPGVAADRLERIRREGPRTRAPGARSRHPGPSRASDRRPGPPRPTTTGPTARDPRSAGAAARGRRSRRPGGRRPPGPDHGAVRPGLEALRLAIHRPEAVGDRLEEVLFTDPVQRAAFVALVESDDLARGHRVAPAQVQALLVRADRRGAAGRLPDEVVPQLLRDAVRRELPVLTVEARTSAGGHGQEATSGRPGSRSWTSGHRATPPDGC